MKKIFFLFLVVILNNSSAQVYNMSNGYINTCNGNFYDSGGNSGNYGNNESFVLTFCSNIPGQCMKVIFSSFSIQAQYDSLTIYDGPDTNSFKVGVFTDTIVPDTIAATTGCLTFKFVSDNSGTSAGWSATISCVQCPVQPCSLPCAGAPPANDSCFHSINFGLLPPPQPCPSATGADTTIIATNFCASQEADHVPSGNCSGGSLQSPLADVWFAFDLDTSNGPVLNVNINSSVIHPALILYAGNYCSNMIELACDVSSTTNLTTQFTGLGPGHYFLQVCSQADTSQCDFSITLNNSFNCTGCVQQAELIVSPLPVAGTYPPGTSVNFCLNITSFSQVAINWLHAVVPTFGAGWDLSTFIPVPATHCDTSGYWEWMYTPVFSLATGAIHDPGFYYESVNGNINMMLDNDPGNNYGDQNSQNACDWTFCWTMSTRSDSGYCMDGSDLNIVVDTYGDGESGSWTSYGCDQDPLYYFFGDESCCVSVDANVTNSCTLGQASVIATSLGLAPLTFEWKDSMGVVIATDTINTGNDSLQNLYPGNYSVDVSDSNGCVVTYNFIIPAPVTIQIDTAIAASCIGCSDGSILFSVSRLPYSVTWSPQTGILNGSRIDSLPSGVYVICVTDTMGCISCDSIFVAENTESTSTIFFEKSISVFPNPTNDKLMLQFAIQQTSVVSIAFYDAFGKQLDFPFEEKQFPSGLHELNFDCKNMINGMYFMEIKTENQSFYKKILIVKNQN